jgi:hypothetical protein
MVAIRARNKRDLWGNVSFEKANAARLEVKVPTRLTEITIIRLFLNPESRGISLHISIYFLKLTGFGMSFGGISKTVWFVFSEVDSIHTKGKIITTEKARSIPNTSVSNMVFRLILMV